ncbi:GAF domain-containing protein [Spongiactinospora gelatinilytica]|uniref:GAF domain-containing protein n=1 Tax=Spongiactinospora gelatinilytica TaxID=2666298 RepID=A0A2W2H4Y4_9ACTN|nr:GAF domain-containing protein [Spongiactinospora gelatinilytica]PZG47075.1 GAF domain-containing protein [Spongiactinospora gelatinilytica]
MSADDIDGTERRLLQSIVEVARHMFGAAASSIFLVDPDTGDLVFEAVSGEGEKQLVGSRFPMGTGIAGWVAVSGQPMVADDVSTVSQFAQDAAESTGYVPRTIMAAPLIRFEECVGVLEVLDRTASRSELDDMEMLGLFATQAACGLELLLRVRRNRQEVEHPDPRELLRRIGERLPGRAGRRDAAVVRLLAIASDLLDH